MKSKLINLFTVFVALLTVFQGLISDLPIKDESTLTIISAVTMFLVTGITVWKQYVSDEIANKALVPTLIVAIVATIGGFNDLLNAFPIPEVTGQWLRFSITFITAGLNIISKVLYPTPETKSLL
jgi:hypothetical protein